MDAQDNKNLQQNSNNNSSDNGFMVIDHEQKYDEDPSQEIEQDANGVNNNDNRKRVIACTPFQPHKPKQPGLRANVFVSKDCTRDLSEHIVEENWGNEHGMLYKYLDYIFRCQIFDKQVKKITYSTSEEIVVFHTGLQRRHDHEFLYFVLKSNDPEKRNAEQRWRVPAGSINNSCFSKNELKEKWLLEEEKEHLPERTKFYKELQELLFDETYEIEVNWPERLRTNKERIYQELKQTSKDIDKSKLVQDLSDSFAEGLRKAQNRAKANPRLAVAQGFVETKHYKKRVELLLPLKIEYPKDSKKYHTFALALRKTDKKYTGMSLLTMSMAYANARLVGYVDSSWLNNEAISNKKDKKGDKERDQHLQSQANQKINHPLMVNNLNKGNSRYQSMTFNQQRGGTSRGQTRSRTMVYGMNNVNPSYLPPIPDSQVVGLHEVILDDGPNNNVNGISFPTTNIQQQQQNNNTYYQPPQQKYNPQYPPQQQQHPQQIQQMQQQQQQQPFIDNASQMSDDNRPLSTYDHQQNMNEQQRRGFQSGQALQPAVDLKYARSAYPVMNTQPEPELHNPMPANDEEEANDDLYNNHPAFDPELKLDDTARGFDLDDDTEQQIANLKYRRSEPAIKSSANKTLPTNKFKQTLRKKYQSPLSPNQNQNQQIAQQITTPTIPKQAPIHQHYHSDSVARLPEKVKKYAQPNTQQWGVVPYAVIEYHKNSTPNDSRSLKSVASDSQKWLLQLSRLPGDCGVNTLRQIFTASGCKLQSVHLVDDDKTAVLRFPDQNALQSAAEFVSKFKWRSKIIQDSPYLKNYDQQRVWQYQESTKWRAHHPKMGELIEHIPPRTDLIIEHGNRKYFIEKYNKQQGRQTNLRTKNQRMIRRIRIHVWAPKTNPIWSKAIPRIIPQHPQETYDSYFGLPQQQQQQQQQPQMTQQQQQQAQNQQSFPYPTQYEQKQDIPVPHNIISTKSHQSAVSNHTHTPSHSSHQHQQHQQHYMTQPRGGISSVEAEIKGMDPKAPVFTPNINTQPQSGFSAIGGVPQQIPQQIPQHLQQQQIYYSNNNNNHPNRQTLATREPPTYHKSMPPKPSKAFDQTMNNPASKIPPSAASSNNNNRNGPMSVVRVTKTFTNWENTMDEPDEADIEILVDECEMEATDCSGLWLYIGPKVAIKQMANGSKNETLYYIPNGDQVENIMNNGVDNIQSFLFFPTVRRAIQTFSNAQDDNNNVTVFLCEVTLDQNQQTELAKTNQVNVTDSKRIEFLAAAAININILKKALQL